MGILKKPYEISLWEDKWDGSKFVEKRLMVIGTDTMTSQNRAIEPMLTTNVNGQKSFTFKMYKRYVDNVTGEEVENLFSGYLINERKVKLHYNDKWYDFIIKGVSETSTNYLYSYELVDAIVEELSKNGYDVTLDAELMNNVGTAQELAEKVMEGTDWKVESEVFVEKIEEALVYVAISNKSLGNAKKITDQTDLEHGISIGSGDLFDESKDEADTKTCLAFYSSCIDKPHRFQFIYLDDYTDVSVNDKRVIQVPNCQYFIEIQKPDDAENGYKSSDEGYWLPQGVTLAAPPTRDIQEVGTQEIDTQLSNKYRGERIGFAQKQKYVPLLNRYVKEYSGHSETMTEVDAEYAGTSDRKALRYEIDISKDLHQNISYKIEYEPSTIKLTGGILLNSVEGATWTRLRWVEQDQNFDDLIKYLLDEFLPQNPGAKIEKIFIGINGYSKDDFTLDSLTLTKTYKSIYGYSDAKYITPNIQQNLVANASFEGTSGWEYDKSGEEITVESVYGKFDSNDNNKFVNAIDSLKQGNTDWTNYQNCLKITCNKRAEANEEIRKKYRVINSGLFDNRTLLENLKDGDELMLRANLRISQINVPWDSIDAANLYFDFYNVEKTESGYTFDDVDYLTKDATSIQHTYTIPADEGEEPQQIIEQYYLYKFNSSAWTEKEFKNHRLRLVFDIDKWAIDKNGDDVAISEGKQYYLTRAELYKVHRDAQGNIIFPNTAQSDADLPKSETIYNFLDPAYVEEGSPSKVDSKEKIPYITTSRTRDYSVYKPIYNDNGQRIQVINAKESNRFNILQTIAETFKCWLELDIGRDNNGGISQKTIRLKNYSGGNNYAAFRYGVNLKDIQRTHESKSLVTKLIVKPNKNSLAENGSCTIQTAGANPTGEDYIYDFGYYHKTGMLNTKDFVDYAYGASGKKGLYTTLRECNNKMLKYNKQIVALQNSLIELEATQEAELAAMSAALEEKDELAEKFKASSGGVAIGDIEKVYSVFTEGDSLLQGKELIPVTEEVYPEDSLNDKKGHYTTNYELDWVDTVFGQKAIALRVQTNTSAKFGIVTAAGPTAENTDNNLRYKDGVPQVLVTIRTKNALEVGETKTISLVLYPEVVSGSENGSVRVQSISVYQKLDSKTLRKDSEVIHDFYVPINSYESTSTTESYIQAYTEALGTYQELTKSTSARADDIESKKGQLKILQTAFETERKNKLEVTSAFYSKYNKFIKEGTWQSEEHIEANKYYADAQSVLYNSCYPQVAYTINVLSVSQIPGYELFNFELGEQTYVEDGEFFGYDENGYPISTQVIISEKVEFLDTPDKETIKVQNFKDQFQDLFQKITATVQQTQYSTGAYKEAVALTEAKEGRNVRFLEDALSQATAELTAGGDNTVTWGKTGITVRNNKGQAIRLVGGAILLGSGEESGTEKWSTGLTAKGISANKITAGTIDTSQINIKNGTDTSYVLDEFGLTAHNVREENDGSVLDLVRFDKHGIYGVTNVGTNGWVPDNASDIDRQATFALTWDGLKVTGDTGVVARIGRLDGNIIDITNKEGSILQVSNNGEAKIAGWNISQYALTNFGTSNTEGKNDNSFCMQIKPKDTDSEETNALAIGTVSEGDWDSANFIVRHDGTMFSKQGRIGAWTINQSALIGQYQEIDSKIYKQVEISEVGIILRTSSDQKNWTDKYFSTWEDLLLPIPSEPTRPTPVIPGGPIPLPM